MEPDALTSAVRLQRYEICDVLGHGTFGTTYRAVDQLLGRSVAIKEFLPVGIARREDATHIIAADGHDARFERARKGFLSEARTLAALEGTPGIVRVLDFLEANGTAYMVMPLLHGLTLEAELARSGPMPEDRLRRLAEPLLEGLRRVHGAGFLHRDIKPANIMLSDEAGPTLLDFGAARTLLAADGELTRIYTPGYAPLEQLTGGKQGPWTDIYALGATFYECVTGRKPPSAVDRLAGGVGVEYSEQIRGTYSGEFLSGIKHALLLKPEDRPQSIAAWRHLLGETWPKTTSATPTIEMPKASPPEVSERLLLGLWRKPTVVAGIVLATVALTFSWHDVSRPIRRDPPQEPVAPKVEVIPTPDQTEARLELTPYDIERVQVGLTAQGFSVGSFDGALSPDTRAMIAAWQRKEGHETTGYLDRAQYDQLLSQAAEAIAKYDDEQRRGKGDR